MDIQKKAEIKEKTIDYKRIITELIKNIEDIEKLEIIYRMTQYQYLKK